MRGKIEAVLWLLRLTVVQFWSLFTRARHKNLGPAERLPIKLIRRLWRWEDKCANYKELINLYRNMCSICEAASSLRILPASIQRPRFPVPFISATAMISDRAKVPSAFTEVPGSPECKVDCSIWAARGSWFGRSRSQPGHVPRQHRSLGQSGCCVPPASWPTTEVTPQSMDSDEALGSVLNLITSDLSESGDLQR